MSAETMTPEIIEEWQVIDRWWTDDPDVVEFAEVRWGVRRVVMVRRGSEHVWRVHQR